MKVLLVDDSAFVRNILVKSIAAVYPDAVIILCANGQEAIEAFPSFKPDWVITDLLMPGISGQDLLVKLHTFDHLFKTIVISADVQTGTKDDLESYGIESFINKPLTADKLMILTQLLKASDVS
jgi:two-component system chemotaxis response regulator CheY